MPRISTLGLGAAMLLSLIACKPMTSPFGQGHLERSTMRAISNGSIITPAPFGTNTKARLYGSDGVRIGDVEAWQGRDGVLVKIHATNLPPCVHGAHIHSIGICDGTTGFKTSGGHVGKHEGPHGLLHPEGAHRGNLPNIHVGKNGKVRVEYFSSLISLMDLQDKDGAALIIHTFRDDHQSQPIGGSGPRIACAPFSKRAY